MSDLPLQGLCILDASNYLAGPMSTTILADFGADVITVEHPATGDPFRDHGYGAPGMSLWWKELGRNKRCITLYLGCERGQEIFRRLARRADVVVENFRPGRMAAWGLGYADLAPDNPSLVMMHVSGYGQVGPRSREPVFGTLIESMSGFAHRNGDPDGSPTLPPFGLADCLTGYAGTIAILTALRYRDATGRGQEIDLSMIEPLLTVLEPQLITYDQLNIDLGRTGNRSAMNAPRDLYRARDGQWVAISASSAETAGRLMSLVGWDQVTGELWFRTAQGRKQHDDELDTFVAPWVAARDARDAVAGLAAAEVPAGLVYSPREILADEQINARGAVARVPDDELGTVRMPNVLFRLSESPGSIRRTGASLGADNDEVYGSIGIGPDELEQLRDSKVV